MLVSSLSSQPSIWMRLSGLARLMGPSRVPPAPAEPLPFASVASRSTAVDVFRSSATPWVSSANRIFLSQDPGPYNPEASFNNTNCGPTSLAMALSALGLRPPGLPANASVENWIDAARYAMRGDTNDYELTSDDDVLQGALQSGARAWKVTDHATLDQALDAGALVVLAGNPAAYAGRFDSRSLRGFDGGHFILVAGRSGDRYVINDPLSRVGALTVTADELMRYMAYRDWHAGVAVTR